MLKRPPLALWLLLAVPLLFSFRGEPVPAEAGNCRKVIHAMFDSIRKVENIRYLLFSSERVNGKQLTAQTFMKVNVTPRKIHMFNPVKGLQILYVSGWNNNNALVKSKSFPFMNFNLDPLGGVMRKDQHHTIFELGFTYIGTAIATGVLRSGKDFDKEFHYIGNATFDKKDCHHIEIRVLDFKYFTYKTGKGETVASLARKFNVADYKIRTKNDLSSYYGTIKEGKELLIPSHYASKITLYVDKKSGLPVVLKAYDDEGLYESYEFHNLKVNTEFASDEFTKGYKDYSF